MHVSYSDRALTVDMVVLSFVRSFVRFLRSGVRPTLDPSAETFLADVNSRSRSLLAIAIPSVCRLSVVCDVGAPYSGG